MPPKPSYADLEKRVTALEQIASEYEMLKKELSGDSTFNEDVVKAMSDGLVLTDIQGIVTFVNPGFVAMLGYQPEEIIGRLWLDIIPPNHYDMVLEAERRRADGKTDRYEMVLQHKSGEKLPVLIDAIPRVDKQTGEFAGTLGFVTDITQRKHTETALKKDVLRYRLLFEQSPIGVFHFDNDGTIVDCNDNFVTIIGSSRKVLVGLNMLTLPDKKLVRELQKAINGHTGFYEGVYQSITAEKSTPVKVYVSPLLDKACKSFGYVGIVEDITDQKQAEAERESLQTQLIQAQKMESVGRLAGGVAHDFNNMLTVNLGYAQAAMDQTDPCVPVHKDLQEVITAARRSADLTRQLLTFARKEIITPKVLDLNVIVESMLSMLRRLIGEDIDLAWHPGTGLGAVEADPSQIDQVLVNLCVNAKDAIADVGKITIETDAVSFDQSYCQDHPGFFPGDFVMLAVKDDGSGMDRHVLANLFEPFFTTKDVGEGTGLGLSTVYGIVQQNKGFLAVDSTPGQGSTFRVYLPLHMEVRTSHASILSHKFHTQFWQF